MLKKNVPFINFLSPEEGFKVSFESGDEFRCGTEADLSELFKDFEVKRVLCSSDVDYAKSDFGIDARAIVATALDY